MNRIKYSGYDYCLAIAVIGLLCEILLIILYIAGVNKKWGSENTTFAILVSMRTIGHCNLLLEFPEILSQNHITLSLTECFWDFQNNAMRDSHKHALLADIKISFTHDSKFRGLWTYTRRLTRVQ